MDKFTIRLDCYASSRHPSETQFRKLILKAQNIKKDDNYYPLVNLQRQNDQKREIDQMEVKISKMIKSAKREINLLKMKDLFKEAQVFQDELQVTNQISKN